MSKFLVILFLPFFLFGDVDQYIISKGYHNGHIEGYITEKQKKDFKKNIGRYGSIKKILEIGFNAGHSAEFFLKQFPAASLTSVDICSWHEYTRDIANFMAAQYGDRFTFYEGDSTEVIPRMTEAWGKVFDLIFIDGAHDFEYALADIQNCRFLAHENTIVCIDDFYMPSVAKAIYQCIHLGILKDLRIHENNDRSWAEARYILP